MQIHSLIHRIQSNGKEKGSTLVIAMLMLLVLLGLAASMTFSAQSQANMASAVKLQQFYETAALNAFNHARSTLADHWVDVDSVGDPSEDYRWRFGQLLHEASQKTDLTNGNFPENELLDYAIEMNSGMLELTYQIWVANNPDDPSVLMQGYALDQVTGDRVINSNWDMDGKVILTVLVFAPGNTTTPVVTQSALLSPVGGEFAYLFSNSVREGDESSEANQGRGTSGTEGRISIRELDDGET